MPDGVLAPNPRTDLWLNGEGLFWFQPPLHALVLPPEVVTCLSSLHPTLHNSLYQILPPASQPVLGQNAGKSICQSVQEVFKNRKRKVKEIRTFSTLPVPTFLVCLGLFFFFPLEAEDTDSYLSGSETCSTQTLKSIWFWQLRTKSCKNNVTASHDNCEISGVYTQNLKYLK